MKELGQKLNLAESTISGYENGNRKPDYDTLNKFADFFDVSTDYLLGRDVAKQPIRSTDTEDPLSDPKLGIWFKDIKDASPEKQEELKLFWEFIKEKRKIARLGIVNNNLKIVLNKYTLYCVYLFKINLVNCSYRRKF